MSEPDPTSPRLVGGPRRPRPELTEQENARFEPVSLDGTWRDAKQFRYFAFREAAKEPELNDLAEAFIDHRQTVERLVECQDLVELDLQRDVAVAQRDARRTAAVLFRSSAPGEIDEHLAHRTRRRSEEMRAPLPVRRRSAAELEKRLMNQLGGRERSGAVDGAEMVARHTLELIVRESVEVVVLGQRLTLDSYRRQYWIATRIAPESRPHQRLQ